MADKKLKIGEQSCRDGLNWIKHSNYPEALSAFKKSFEYGFKPAANHLGIMYLSGEGVEKDYTKALSYFIEAADIPNTNAAYNAARILESGDAGYTDAARSIFFYEKALKWNDKEAAYNLGVMYLNEKLIPKDIEKGILYLGKASALLHARAPFTLAWTYLSIDNDPETIEESVRLFTLSSQRGFEEADLTLGIMYKENEILEEESERKAEQHFSNVLNGSNNETKLELALYLSKRSDISSFYKARDIVKLLIEDKYPPAICMFKYKNDTNSIDAMSDYGVIQCDDMEIKDLISELYLVVSLIKESHAFNDGNISHFTSWPAMESILSIENKKNCLRYYHVDYMNDPSEGRTLLNHPTEPETDEYIAQQVLKSFSAEVFNMKPLVKDTLPSVYSLSFTSESDRLDLWRAYGNDGDGFSITIPIDEGRNYERISFAKKAFEYHLEIIKNNAEDSAISLEDECFESREIEGPKVPKVYHVKYDRESITRALLLIHKPLVQINKKLDTLSQHEKYLEHIKMNIISIILDIMYLYKDEQYSTEKEVRAIRVESLNDVLMDERVPARLYCTTDNFLFDNNGSKITIGPKVEEKNVALWNLKYRINKLDFSNTTSIEISKVQYR